MKNNSNIYDIDGELIRKFGDNHKLTLQEAQKKVKFYAEKLKELKNDDPKVAIYNTYIRNLNGYIFNLYSQMSMSEIKDELGKLTPQNTTEEQVKTAIEELKSEIEPENKDYTVVEAEDYDEDLVPKQQNVAYNLPDSFYNNDSFTEITEENT